MNKINIFFLKTQLLILLVTAHGHYTLLTHKHSPFITICSIGILNRRFDLQYNHPPHKPCQSNDGLVVNNSCK